MKYLKLFWYFFLLAFLSAFKRGSRIGNKENYIVKKINKTGLFQFNITSIEYSFPVKFLFDSIQVNKGLNFSINLKHCIIRFSPLLSIQLNAQQLLIYNNDVLDIKLSIFSSIISLRPSASGFKLFIRNELNPEKLALEMVVTRNFVAKTNSISINSSAFTLLQIVSMFERLSYSKLSNIQFMGAKSFALQFVYSYLRPMNYTFHFEVKGENGFEINSKSILEFDHLQNDKPQTIIDNNSNVRTFLFNEMSNGFVSIHDIPDIVLKTIITTEDPNFLFHNGFDIDCFGFALATNIDTKKFTRGGSTITMQLIRNLYLNHSKTFSRKLEEIILTWIIEEQLHIPKDKILEVYLNRIEMGPGVYGIKEAAYFYFDKQVEDLNLLDSLVLSYIIPRPKFFLPALLDQSPILKKNLKLHIKKYVSLMKHREHIDEADFLSLKNTIHFSESLGMLHI